MDQNMFLAAAAGHQNMMSYSPFASVDGSWTPTAYDPSLMTAFGFTGAGMMSGQALASAGFYFPGTTPDLSTGIWGGQESTTNTANPLMLSSFMMNPLSMDPQQLSGSEIVALDGNIAAVNNIDPMIGLNPAFSGMTVNGGTGGGGGSTASSNVMQLGQTTALPSTTGVSTGVINGAPQTVTPVPNQGLNTAPQPEKPKSWAAIASQPAKPRPPPPPKPQPQPEINNEVVVPANRKSGNGRSGNGNNQSGRNQGQSGSGGSGSQSGSSKGMGSVSRRTIQNQHSPGTPGGGDSKGSKPSTQSELVGKLRAEKNPTELTMNINNARFFVIKSYAEDDIHRSIKYSIWTSTEHGNRRLDQAYRELKGKGGIYLFYSVNGSGHFCGVAQMMSEVDFNTITGVWAQDKWKGRFQVKWIYVKDVPNSQLRHIRLENNENKPVTNSRDTQEIPLAKAKQVIKIVHSYQHTTSIFDDFDHYEKKEEEESKVSGCGVLLNWGDAQLN